MDCLHGGALNPPFIEEILRSVFVALNANVTRETQPYCRVVPGVPLMSPVVAPEEGCTTALEVPRARRAAVGGPPAPGVAGGCPEAISSRHALLVSNSLKIISLSALSYLQCLGLVPMSDDVYVYVWCLPHLTMHPGEHSCAHP